MPPSDDIPNSPDLARRRSDGAAGADRALDWSSRPTDVLLFPHSPLALIDVLEHPEGVFDLQPFENSTPDDSGADVQAITSGDPKPPGARSRAHALPRPQRSRMNLLTRHPSAELRDRCRRAIVESALVRTRKDRRLYLAAGFVSGPGLRAPVLLYPALLVGRSDSAGQEVRIEGVTPDMNRRLAQHVRDAFGIGLPERADGESLVDFFARLAAVLAPLDGIELEFDVALGTASAGFLGHEQTGRGALPDVPARFDVALAMALATDVSLEQLHAVLHLMPDVGTMNVGRTAATAGGARHGRPAPDAESGEAGNIARLRDYSVKLAARGLDHVEFGRLPGLPEMIESQLRIVAEARASETVDGVFGSHAFKVRQLVRLGGIVELVDKAPAFLEQYQHADLGFSNTGTLLRRARHQAQLIEDEFAALQQWFLLDKVPAKPQLLQLIEEIEGAVAHGPDVVDADYFHARRQFMEISVEKASHLNDEHRRRLAQLAKVLRFRELFVNNTEYRRALGSGYRGLRTDWISLGLVTDYARELGDFLDSEALAACAMSDFTRFRTAIVCDLDLLRPASGALLSLLELFGAHWQTRGIDDFEQHAREIATRLGEWRATFGDMPGHGKLTPAEVLSQFCGQTHRDAETERRVIAARVRIGTSLESGEIEPLAIAETLEWLRAASVRAAEHQLDIGAIVDHLQIA